MQRLFPLFLSLVAFVSVSSSAQEAAAVRAECSGAASHVEMRACLQAKVNTSTRELRDTENQMRKLLAAWNQEPEFIKRSTSEFETAAKQFGRFGTQQCDFIASLAAGGNGKNDLRLSCLYELNTKRVAQIQQIQALLQ